MLENFINTKELNTSVEHIRSSMNEAVTALEGNAKDLLNKSGDLVKKYPLYTIMGAAAVGFVAGSFLREAIRKSN